jgi:hypothetical protein
MPVLHYAVLAQTGQSKAAIVSALVEKGADVNCQGKDRTTPLMWASVAGESEFAHFLKVHGADENLRDENGRTAADWAEAGRFARARQIPHAAGVFDWAAMREGNSSLSRKRWRCEL